MKLLLNQYLAAVRKNCTEPGLTTESSVAYWRNHFFANTMAVIIPFSLITVIPGVAFSLHLDLYTVAVLDLLSFLGLFYIGFGRGLRLETRKMLFMGVTYFAAAFLLYYIGIVGPGVLFLYAACIFGILILSRKYAYLWSFINIAICALFALVLHFNLSPTEDVNSTTVAEWIAIAANVIFLSLLSSAMLPRIFTGLSKTVRKQFDLQQELIAQSKSLEHSLREIEKKNAELEKFAYTVSHDLQEPLRMITGFLSQLDHKYGDQLDDKGRQHIQFAYGGASRMRQIILDLLQYSRVGQDDHIKEQVDIEEIIADYRNLRNRVIKEKSASILLETPITVSSYKAPLIQALHNLIDNALKYSKDDVPPEVHISVSEQPDYWLFSVSDNGIGIEEEYFDKIFILFQRLHAADKYEGTGLGLSIVKKIVESLGGKIQVESEPGKGSTFSFTIAK